jgi:carbamoyl-phosphate synthase large subunit
MKVLITGAGALLGQGIIRALRASALDATIIGVDPNPLSAGLYWVDRARIVPMAKDPNYLPVIEGLIADECPDAILVGTDVELAIFAAHRTRLETLYDTRVLVSDPLSVAIAEDKWLTNRFLVGTGLPYPQSCLPGDEEILLEKVGFPLVVKPRIGSRSYGVQKVTSRQELAAAIARTPGCVIQHCIGCDDEEYTAGALVFDDRCEASIVMRRLLKDGNTYQAFVEDFPELNLQVRHIAVTLGGHGPVNLQFRLDDGVPKVFEINARFSGTTPLRAHAGFNEVEMSLRHLLYGEPIVQPEVEPMTILRHWSETVIPGRPQPQIP